MSRDKCDIPSMNDETTPKSESVISVNNMESAKSVEYDDPKECATENIENLKYGWWKIHPEWLQFFKSPKWVLFWLCWGATFQGMMNNGYISIVLQTIERRFDLRSFQSGLIVSCFNVAIVAAVVPVTYFGGRPTASKPKWIGMGLIVMSFGALLFAVPHLFTDTFTVSAANDNLCRALDVFLLDSKTPHIPPAEREVESLSWNIWIFLCAQLLLGAGSAPIYTLGFTYIDDIVSRKMSPVYLGIFQTFCVIGPAFGFVFGGQILLWHTDFLSVDTLTLGISPDNRLWIGAWWMGFLILAAVSIVIALPILGYPRGLTFAESKDKKETVEKLNDSTSKKSAKDMPTAILALIKNKTYMILSLGSTTETILTICFAVFLPKIIENQFSVNSEFSSILLGSVIVIAGGGGAFFGGYIIKRLKLTSSGIIKFCICTSTMGALITLGFTLSCPNQKFAGVTVPYQQSSENSIGNLTSNCNSNCGCDDQQFDPICGADNKMYYSPCHAGCATETMKAETSVRSFNDCGCIKSDAENNLNNYGASSVICASECKYLVPFIVLCFLMVFSALAASIPAVAVTIRCVREDQKSLAIGVQYFLVFVLGCIPAPILFGKLIDNSCILWQKASGDSSGSCLMYDNTSMSKYVMGFSLCVKSLSIIFFSSALYQNHRTQKNANSS